MTRIDQAAKLFFIDACISETMRLRPVAPVSALTASREVVLEGVRVPPGTEVITLMRIGATAEENVPSPLRFLPDRWLTTEAGRDSTKRWMFPFGGGPRYCPGGYLALLEVKMVISMLSRNFERPEVQSESGAEPREIFNFTMMPSPLSMKLVPRARASGSG
jgi:cytochrome P450